FLNSREFYTRPQRKKEIQHANLTYDLISSIGVFKPLARIAASVHENYDGSGYPLGLEGEEIPPVARIIAQKTKEIYVNIEKTLDRISESPKMYRESNKRNGLRKCVFSKQTSIYYRINEDHIEIVSFRPNRKDPNKFKI
ncbi:MAG: HD domain-containing phosphohydrolase, partial [Cyclobacterium sp.]|uniref:HD domain-containing phosphohydrolase n=1 Tax=Cyclobacterium sp. TaxID=1966343 RepID=UPI0039707341